MVNTTPTLEDRAITKTEEESIREAKLKLDELMKGNSRMKIYLGNVEFAVQLKRTFTDYEEYRAYHLLANSSPLNCKKFDFPGDHSVLNYINEQYQNFK